METSRVRQHPVIGPETLNKSPFSTLPPEPAAKITRQLLPGDEGKSEGESLTPAQESRLCVKHWAYRTK